MKLGELLFRQGISRALEWFDAKYQAEERAPAGELCDGFEKSVRKIPRNICADPAVEAKRAVSECLKSGFLALQKSIVNCLTEANESYEAEYLSSLQSCCADYLNTTLKVAAGEREASDKLLLVFSRAGIPYTLELVLNRETFSSEFRFVSRSTGTRRVANEADFACLTEKN